MPPPDSLPARLVVRGPGLAGLLAAVLVLSGCETGLSMLGRKAPPPATPAVSAAEADRALLEWLEKLRLASPAQQAELVAAARSEWEQKQSPEGRLRLGLALSNPHVPGADALTARQHLSGLLARGDSLPPGHRAIAHWMMVELDARLALQAENLRLQTEGAQRDRDRTVALTRRLQQELDENNRLRRALDDAQKKLAAIIELERGNLPTVPAAAPPAPTVPTRPVKRP